MVPWGSGYEQKVLSALGLSWRATKCGGGGSSDETPKPRCSVTIKIPPRSQAVGAELRPTFCSPSAVLVTSPH